MKYKKMIVLPLLATILCSCNDISGQWKSTSVAERSIISNDGVPTSPFHTYMNLFYFLSDKEAADNKFEQVEKVFTESVIKLHKNFDRHYSYLDENENLINNIKTINDSYGTGENIKCSQELFDLLKISYEAFKLTNGMFNIFTGGLTDYWEFILEEVYNFGDESFIELDPYKNELQAKKLKKLVDVIPKNELDFEKQLTFNDETLEVCFNKIEELDDCSDDFISLDQTQKIAIRPYISVGGIAKGYATDLIKENLVNNGYDSGYISSGGSSITTLAKPIFTKQDGGHKISIVNPKKSDIINKEVAFSMKFSEMFSFSTSGNYTSGKSYSFKDDNGNDVFRHHIINPFTGYPENYYCSVSISSHTFSNALLDSFSTAFMCLSIEDGMKLRSEILKLYPNNDLDVFYLNNDENVTLYATSNVNKTLSVGKGVKVVYES